MSENPAKPTLYAKLAAVLGEIQRVPKSGKNKHFNYEYATNEDVLDFIRPLLAAHGIAFWASMVECAQAAEQTDSGKTTTRTHIVLEFAFADVDSGEVITSRWHGEALDSQDKGITKAATLAKKYFLLNTFLISTGDLREDPDADAPVEQSKPAPAANGKEGWPTAERIEGLMKYWRGQELTDGDIYRFAGVEDDGDLEGWRKYANHRAATTAIRDAWKADKPAQTAFQQARNGKEAAAPIQDRTPPLPDNEEEVEAAAVKPPF